MRLSPQRFNRFLGKIGQVFAWRRAYACPCRDPHSGAARPGCASCGGKGQVWADPVNGVAGVSGQKIQREWAQFGMWENGDVVLTLPSDSPLYQMGEYDRAVMIDSSAPFSLPLVRGSGDKLNAGNVSIDRVFWLDPDDSIVEGGIPLVAPDGTILWPSQPIPENLLLSLASMGEWDVDILPSGPLTITDLAQLIGLYAGFIFVDEPPDGTQYSVTGREMPEYYVWGDFPSDRSHQGGDALPRRVVLRRFDLYGR